jgi:hypothetical protein
MKEKVPSHLPFCFSSVEHFIVYIKFRPYGHNEITDLHIRTHSLYPWNIHEDRNRYNMRRQFGIAYKFKYPVHSISSDIPTTEDEQDILMQFTKTQTLLYLLTRQALPNRMTDTKHQMTYIIVYCSVKYRKHCRTWVLCRLNIWGHIHAFLSSSGQSGRKRVCWNIMTVCCLKTDKSLLLHRVMHYENVQRPNKTRFENFCCRISPIAVSSGWVTECLLRIWLRIPEFETMKRWHHIWIIYGHTSIMYYIKMQSRKLRNNDYPERTGYNRNKHSSA